MSSQRSEPTVVLHMVDAHLDKARHCAVLPVTQIGQTAAEHLVWRRGEKRQSQSHQTVQSLSFAAARFIDTQIFTAFLLSIQDKKKNKEGFCLTDWLPSFNPSKCKPVFYLSVFLSGARCSLVPLMYPLSLTDCSVGRRVRNFFSLCRVFLLSEPSMLAEVFMPAEEKWDKTTFSTTRLSWMRAMMTLRFWGNETW